jgi:hypothetical protein
MPELTVIAYIIATMLAVIYPSMRICRRAGFPSLLGLLAVVPLVNLALLWFVALAPWPDSEPAPADW